MWRCDAKCTRVGRQAAAAAQRAQRVAGEQALRDAGIVTAPLPVVVVIVRPRCVLLLLSSRLFDQYSCAQSAAAIWPARCRSRFVSTLHRYDVDGRACCFDVETNHDSQRCLAIVNRMLDDADAGAPSISTSATSSPSSLTRAVGAMNDDELAKLLLMVRDWHATRRYKTRERNRAPITLDL